jgi:hypothetical protein
VSQSPQCAALDSVSTHSPPQAVSPDKHSQTPSEQISPGTQALSHSPQCSTLVVWSTQRPLQAAVPSGHEQALSTQP